MRKIFKAITFFLILVLMSNMYISFDEKSVLNTIQYGEKVSAQSNKCYYDKYTVEYSPWSEEVYTYKHWVISSLGLNWGFTLHTGWAVWDGSQYVNNSPKQYNLTVYYDQYNDPLYARRIQVIYTGNYNNMMMWDMHEYSRSRSERKGSLVAANIIAVEGTYPDNGKAPDGYWYVKKGTNEIPELSAYYPIQNQTLSNEDTSIIPYMTVSDKFGDTLTCKYYIDSVEKESKQISNTATPQTVNFSAIDTEGLSDGVHTVTFEVIDGMSDPVIKTVSIIVDKTPPVLVAVSFTANDSDITISGSATDSATDAGALLYRYTAGSTVSGWVNNSSYSIEALSPDTEYSCKLEVKDQAGHVASKEQKVRTKAQTPIINTGSINKDSIELRFNDRNPETVKYQLMEGSRYVNESGEFTAYPVWLTAADKKIVVRGLEPNKGYSFKAKARNSEGLETELSTPQAVTTTAQAPGTISPEKGINFIKLSWEATAGATGYEVEADGRTINTGTETYYLHEGLEPETTHIYRVRIINAGGSSEWSSYTNCTTLPEPPETPEIKETNTARTAVTIAWDAVDKAESYEIEADGVIIAVGAVTEYTHEALQPDTVHTYRIRAVNAGGSSQWSNATEARTLPEPPDIPAGLAGNPARTEITLTWNRAARAEGYEIEADGTRIRLENITEYLHKELTANSTHTYRLRAWNRGGSGEWSEPLTVTTWPDLPVAPENIIATAEKDSITLTWYNVEWAESYDVQIDGKTTENVKGNTYTGKNLVPGSKHVYKLRAKNIGGSSPWSKAIELSTLPQEDESPSAPETAVLSDIVAVVTNKTIQIAWQAVETDAQYEIEVDGTVYDNGKETAYNHLGLKPSTFHTYRVRTGDKNGKGQWCAILSLSTLPNPPDAPKNINMAVTNTQIELRWDREEGTSYDVEVDGKIVDAGGAAEYIDENLAPGTSHTYRVRGRNMSGVTAWSDSVIKSTTSPSYVLSCTKGQSFDFALLAANVKDFSGLKFVVEYNPEELEIQDVCDITTVKETTSGRIAGTNLTVTITTGRIEFTVNESIPAGSTWSGEISTVVFKSKATGKAYIDYNIE
ncbi:exoglucanase B precursor [Ruminiclostridium hungatei]|uniref:Exoglucanase B n=1 Tax=Ruminiclostridium hungatei TaxID=48256 RepID=A0A1V4SRH0_RUMHU|nr:hypothetical protein [Ruminiclostridium hungatei]OPX46462.1 exoglucanase B precursor [Ruminiclostridium hungatei]